MNSSDDKNPTPQDEPGDARMDLDLIDRHLAGILEAPEEARLESLIRSSPAWAQRYREAEEMARLLHETLGGPVPPYAQRAIRDRIAAASLPSRSRAFGARRQLLVAASVLCLLAFGYLFLPKGKTAYMTPVYAAEPMALTDLARSSDVLLIGQAEDVGGSIRFRLDRTVYGNVGQRGLALPASVRAGQHLALFGTYRSGQMIAIVGGERGVVHLDGAQKWEGRILEPTVVRSRVDESVALRTRQRALADLERFLASDASLVALDPSEGLRYAAPITARYLGRFDPAHTRETLMRLIQARAKDPAARNAGAAALVQAEPLHTCRMLLAGILASAPEDLHAESEEGFVVLNCLHLMQRSGGADLAANLRELAGRVRCPSLKRAATAALLAVQGKGSRTPGVRIGPAPRRLTVDGREGVVVPGCQGKAEETLVIFRGEAGLGALHPLVNLAIGQGFCVVVLPSGVMDAPGWLREARSAGLLTQGGVSLLGLGRGSLDAVRAARLQRPARLMLVGRLAAALENMPAGLPAEAWSLDGAKAADGDVNLHPVTDASLARLLADLPFLKQVLEDR